MKNKKSDRKFDVSDATPQIPRKEEYLMLDILYRLLIYFKELDIPFNIDDLSMFSKKFMSGFEWEQEFSKLMYRVGFITIKLDPFIPQTRIVDRGDVFDFLFFMGSKSFGVECKSRHDPLMIGKDRLKGQLWLAKALHLNDLLIAWRTGKFWFLISSKILTEKQSGSMGISVSEIMSQILKDVAKDQTLLDQRFNYNGNVIMGGIYAGRASKILTFRELMKDYSKGVEKKRCYICGRPTYYTCAKCGKPVCLSHAVLCEIENEVYCLNCATPKRCRVCGRMGCSNCITSSGICIDCLVKFQEGEKITDRIKILRDAKFLPPKVVSGPSNALSSKKESISAEEKQEKED